MRKYALAAALTMVCAAGSAFAQTSAGQNAQGDVNHNPAVATDNTNAPVPAHGSNSFTKAQATHRIAKHGFTYVKGLAKDKNGVWHGSAMQNGAPVKVWEDYKGDVGTE